MSEQNPSHLFRVTFYNQGQIYEVYARSVGQSGLYGFVEIEELVFGERSELVVDPSEERLASEFSDVTRSYIPMHAVVRIDEVSRRGKAKVTDAKGDGGKIMPFPGFPGGSDQ